MSLTLYFHPLSSYCHKVLIALYEKDLPFEKRAVDLGNDAERAALLALWPIGKFPVLHDEAHGRTVPESSIIIEYLDGLCAKPRMIPADPDEALQVRLQDRFLDLYVHSPMQKIVGDRLRPPGEADPFGVKEAKARLELAYGMLDARLRDRTWIEGEHFTMADCAAAPPLFFGSMLVPFETGYPALGAYFERLKQRPSYARALAEARPFLHMVPRERDESSLSTGGE
jgi:glutathione S-transferase